MKKLSDTMDLGVADTAGMKQSKAELGKETASGNSRKAQNCMTEKEQPVSLSPAATESRFKVFISYALGPKMKSKNR